MPLEPTIWNWLAANWPSAFGTLVLAAVYLRIGKALDAVEATNKMAAEALKMTKRLVRAHLRRFPDDLDELLKDEEDK